jgi:hypothetical protein
LVLFVIGELMAVVMLFSKFGHIILNGDSVVPNSLFVLSQFTIEDLLLIIFSAISYISGLYILFLGIFMYLKKKNQHSNLRFYPIFSILIVIFSRPLI